MNSLNLKELGLQKYEVILSCVPFPYCTAVIASCRDSAIGKARYQAKRCNLDAGELLDITERRGGN